MEAQQATPSTVRTVRVRIPVSVAPDGSWVSHYYISLLPVDNVFHPADWVLHYVEADIPIPEIPVIQGTVTPAG